MVIGENIYKSPLFLRVTHFWSVSYCLLLFFSLFSLCSCLARVLGVKTHFLMD